jgi:hypothetical protein
LLKDIATGGLLTWVNKSYGGRRYGLGEFLKEHASQVKQYPAQDPVIVLTSYYRDTDYGPVATPVLKIVGWQPFGEGRTPSGDKSRGKALQEALREELEPYLALPKPDTAPAAIAAPVAPIAPHKAPQPAGDLNDSIPF